VFGKLKGTDWTMGQSSCFGRMDDSSIVCDVVSLARTEVLKPLEGPTFFFFLSKFRRAYLI
jgi:hypothetical protein